MTGLVAAGLLFSGQAALADPYNGYGGRGQHYGHDRGRDYDRDRRYDYGRDRYRIEYDYARVLDVDPIYRQVRVSLPRQECWDESRYEDSRYDYRGPQRNTAGSMILGGIIGAAIGNQIGSGDGRRAATVAGALIGSAIGHDAGDRRDSRHGYTRDDYRDSRPYTVQRCDVRYDDRYESRIEGYRVTYAYRGRRYTTRMPYDPGNRVRVRVSQPEICG